MAENSHGIILIVGCYVKWRELNIASPFKRITFCKSIEAYLNELPHKEKFNGETLATYFANFDTGDFKRLDSKTDTTNALARYAFDMTYDEFIRSKKSYTYKEILDILEAMGINTHSVDRLRPYLNPKIITYRELEEIEYQKKGIQINCISPSLRWNAHFFDKNIDALKKSENESRLMLTDSLERKYYHRIIDLIKKHNLKNIEIREISSAKHRKSEAGGFPTKRLFEEIKGITLPLADDIAIYRQKNEDGEFDFYLGIIDSTLSDDIDLSDIAFKIGEARAKDLLRWFDAVWDMLDPIS